MATDHSVERTISLPVICVCELAMLILENGLRVCKNESCEFYNIKYKAPTVRLERAEED